MRWVSVCIAVAMVFALGSSEAGARVPSEEPRPLYWNVDPDGEDRGVEVKDVVAGSYAKLFRNENGVSFKIHTTGLKKSHGYTVWFFSYDNPAACRGGDKTPGNMCSSRDLGNPQAGGSIMWGRSGKFVTGTSATFVGRRPKNGSTCATEPVVLDDDCRGVLLGAGLTKPMTAEIHFVLRDHGPDQEGVDDETTTINGGCHPVGNTGLPVYLPGWGTPSANGYNCHDPQGN